MTYNCAHCGEKLTSSPESDAGDWIIRCFHCGARNIIIPVFKLVGWR
jgi:DNA-directed RNA polymerase subunit RPC12/RpoP